MPAKQKLILFGKYPREGFVKMRLARDIGERNATEFFKRCIERIFKEADAVRGVCEPVYCFAEAEDTPLVERWIGKRFRTFPQVTGTLIERNYAAFERMFDEGADKVVIVATDIPGLSQSILKEAFDKLNDSDIVLGLDNDGGYYLLGMRHFFPTLFEIEYGKRPTGEQVIEYANAQALSLAMLPELINVDTIDDLRAWCASSTVKKDLLCEFAADREHIKE